MAINHEITKTLTVVVKDYINDFGKMRQTINAARSEINADTLLSPAGKEKKINELLAAYKPKAEELSKKMVDALERISASEQLNEKFVDPENGALNNAVAVVETLGKNIPRQTVTGYINYFAGNKNALEVLQAALDKNSVNSDIGKYIFDIEETYNGFIGTAAALTVGSPALVFTQLNRNLFETAEKLGVEFTDQEKATEINFNEVFGFETARKAMGLK